MKKPYRSASGGKSYNSTGDMCCPTTHRPPQTFRPSVAKSQMPPTPDCLVSQGKQLAGTK